MKTFTFLILFLTSSYFYAQTSGYTFSVSTTPYQDLTNSTSLNNGQVWGVSTIIIPIGFDFEIGGQTITTLYLPEWSSGVILYSRLNPNGQSCMLIPIAQELTDRGKNSGVSLSPISYKTVGTPGDRILKIEWKNAGFLDNQSDYLNFQIWIYESNSAIAYHYGENSVNQPDAFEGETGPTVGLHPALNLMTEEFVKPAYLLTGDPTNPTLLTIANDESTPNNTALNGMIPNGTVYTFTPKTLAVDQQNTLTFTIYPNPTAEFLHINTALVDYNISIFNSMGKLIKTESARPQKINVANLATGLYFIKLTYQNGKTTLRKFIKQ